MESLIKRKKLQLVDNDTEYFDLLDSHVQEEIFLAISDLCSSCEWSAWFSTCKANYKLWYSIQNYKFQIEEHVVTELTFKQFFTLFQYQKEINSFQYVENKKEYFLHLAAYKGNTEIVSKLLKYTEMDLNLPSTAVDGDLWIDDLEVEIITKDALSCAIFGTCSLEIVNILLENGNILFKKYLRNMKKFRAVPNYELLEEQGEEILTTNIELLRILLKADFKLLWLSDICASAVLKLNGDIEELFDLVLKNSSFSDPNFGFEGVCVETCVEQRKLKEFEKLSNVYHNFWNEFGVHTGFLKSCKLGYTEFSTQFLAHGPEYTNSDDDVSVIGFSAQNGDFEIVKAIVEISAGNWDPDWFWQVRDALDYARDKNNTQIVDYLLEAFPVLN